MHTDNKLFKRVGSVATAIALFGMVLMPSTAFAATSLVVGENPAITEAAKGTGSNGGTWSWDGADALALDNYDGGKIKAYGGDLNVELNGKNTIDNAKPTDMDGCAIIVTEGNLTVTDQDGDGGTLDATSYNGLVAHNGSGQDNGNVTIENTTVNITGTYDDGKPGHGGTAGIQGDGHVSIKDSSVTIKDVGHGVQCHGDVSISNSTVNITSSRSGITAYHKGGATITIDNSDISAHADYHAMLAYDSSYPAVDPITPGVINIKNATILTPNVQVVDAAREIDDVIYVIGQTLGTGSGAIVEDGNDWVKDPALATDVQISKNPSPTPTPTPTPAVTTTASAANIPQTGDELPLTLITVCIITAGAAILLTHRRIA